MSATEVIEQIKILSPQERALVSEFIRQLDTSQSPEPLPKETTRKELEAVATKVFDRYDDLFRKLAQ